MISRALEGGQEKRCRDRAIFEILYAGGLKASELIDLRMENVNTDIGFISCGEGSEQRLIPIYSYASKCLGEYIEKARPMLLGNGVSDLLFLNCDGKKLTRQGLWKIIKNLKKLADIKKDITPHTFRHTFAADLLASGAKLSDVKERLGNTDVSSTAVYEEVNRLRIKEKFNMKHPKVQLRYY